MNIGTFEIDRRPLVIAEIGNNHEGDFDVAVKMIELAAEAGADAVKFQTLRAEKLVSRQDHDRFQRLRQFELTFAQFEQLAKRASNCEVLFLSTPFDLESAQFLNNLCPAFKIASGDNNFMPLLAAVADYDKPILLSTGAADMQRIATAKATIEKVWANRSVAPGLVLLHCVSAYPTPPEDANLAAIATLRNEFGCDVGYSDHTLGIEAAILAVACGAKVVEKHFTLDKHYSAFRDHQLSADPGEMKQLVTRVREAIKLLGDGKKTVQPSEQPVANAVQRRIVAASDIEVNTQITFEHLNWVRRPDGLPAGSENEVIGRSTKLPVLEGTPLFPDDLNPSH